MRLKEAMRKFWVYSWRHSVHHHWAGKGQIWAGAQAGLSAEGKMAHFSKLWHFNLSHLKRNEHWRPMWSMEMGLRLFQDNSELSSVQSTNADAKGCKDAATWFCLAKSNREKHQLSSCISMGPSVEHQRAPTGTDVPVCPCHQHPHSSLTAFIGKSEAAYKSSEAQREQENKSDGFTLEIIKIKKCT